MKPKAKCCKKYKRKKACKRCPLLAALVASGHRPSRKTLRKLAA